MPIVFIHGVNTRDTDPDYKASVESRVDLLERRVLQPLSRKDSRFDGMKIVDAYWGKHGVEFHWNLTSLPPVSMIEHLGEEMDTAEADVVFTESIREMAGAAPGDDHDFEALGGATDGAASDLLCRAAQTDLTTFLERVLTPVLLSGFSITGDIQEPPISEGKARAALAIACVEAGSDNSVRSAVAACGSDKEMMELVRGEVVQKFLGLLEKKESPALQDEEVEELGRPAWLDEIADRAKEVFERALGAPGRTVSIPILQFKRERLNRRMARFLGDIFVYLNERGDATAPGKIVSEVREAIRAAPRVHEGEPLIVITHSMGGNILYDLVTHFDPTMQIDVWVSVGGQVAVFEEMKLYRGSDRQIRAPQKITGLKPRIKYWLNMYDPADPFSFRAAPVFADVDEDVEYLTGSGTLKAHGEYFGLATFYDVVQVHIEKALAGRSEHLTA